MEVVISWFQNYVFLKKKEVIILLLIITIICYHYAIMQIIGQNKKAFDALTI